MRKAKIVNFKFYYVLISIQCAVVLGLSFLCFGTRASLIDAKFKLSKKSSVSRLDQPVNEIGILYKDFLAKSMYSRCRWFPSDSQYLAMISKKCGNTQATLLAFSRFMTEHDADKISEGIINDDGHLRFVDFKNTCDVF